jgi:hypothetical protein
MYFTRSVSLNSVYISELYLLLSLPLSCIAPKKHLRILLSNEPSASSSFFANTQVSDAYGTTGLTINTLYNNGLVLLESGYDFRSLFKDHENFYLQRECTFNFYAHIIFTINLQVQVNKIMKCFKCL